MKITKLFSATLFALALASIAKAAEIPARTWAANCNSCHGTDGKGATTKGKQMGVRDFSTAVWQSSTTDDKIKIAIVNGMQGLTSGRMNGFQSKLKPEQIDAQVKYVRSLGR